MANVRWHCNGSEVSQGRPDTWHHWRWIGPRTGTSLKRRSGAGNQMLTDGLQSARSEREKLMGSNPSQWSWGRLHTVSFRHALGQQPDAKDFFDLGPVSRPGDEYTVNATGGNTWEQISGASYREILDTSN